MSKQQTSIGQWFVAGVVVVAAIAGGAYIWQKAVHGGTQESASTTTTSVPSPATSVASSTSAPIQHPITQAEPASASTAPLPALDNSDTSAAAALAGLAGGNDLTSLLLSDQIIPRIVATIDALPRQSIGSLHILPVHTPMGQFMTTQANGATVISERNVDRYAPYMRIVDSADPKAVVAWYVRFYPLFQQAYRELGYPKAYFNDRLVAVIDNMLAAPDLTQSPTLMPSKAQYAYTDPGLESLSVGQKMLIRIGPVNEAILKAKLRAIRLELTRQPPH
ncbi:MAG: DUF3014 domain-containing protein [Rhodanobacter sp.]